MPTHPLTPHNGHRLHWPYVFKRKRQRARNISASQMAYSQVVSLIGSVLAGYLLEVNKDELALFVGAFVVLPGVFDLGGSIGAALSAKINHLLDSTNRNPILVYVQCVWFALRQALIGSILVAIVGAGIAAWLFGADMVAVFWLTIGSIFLSTIFGFPLVGLLSVLFYRLGTNPDDVVGPIESSIFDILTVVTMTIMATVLL